MDEVLVTGGAGFLGSHLVENLIKHGFGVRVLDNVWRGAQRYLSNVIDDIEFIEASVTDFEKIREASVGVKTIYHLASIQGTKNFYLNPNIVLDVGILGNLNVAKASVENNVKRILFTSSSEVYGNPQIFPTPETSPIMIPDIKNARWAYSIQKAVGESIFLNYAKKFGFDATIVRIHNAYGPRMGWNHVIPEFIKRLVLNEKFTIQGTGKETRSFCYVDDIINGIILAATHNKGKNDIFNLGNPNEEKTINQLVEELGKMLDRKITPTHINILEGSTLKRLPDISKASKLLGYSPKITLKEGLEKTFDWYKKEIKWCIENKSSNEYLWN